MSRQILNLERVTDAVGFVAYRQDPGGPGAQAQMTFVSNERGHDVLDAIRDCAKDIRSAAPSCEIASQIAAIGDQIEAILHANDQVRDPA